VCRFGCRWSAIGGTLIFDIFRQVFKKKMDVQGGRKQFGGYPKRRAFSWMTVHSYKPDKPVTYPFKDYQSLSIPVSSGTTMP
jgi:hypothetical protein